MLSRFTISVVVVLLVSAGASADPVGGIFQFDNFTVGLDTVIGLFQGQNQAISLQNISLNKSNVGDAPHPTVAWQSTVACLQQRARAESSSGIVDVLGSLQAGGAQDQAISRGVGPKVQLQGLGLTGTQVIVKAGGFGSADTEQRATLNEAQTGTNTGGTVVENMNVNLGQTALLVGQPTSTGTVANHATIIANQGQQSY